MAKRVLIVDDALIMRKRIRDIAERAGWEVAGEAANGEEALGLCERQQFDVMILDMVMPGLSGIEVLEKLKENHSECEVIMLTGQGTIEVAVQAMKLGAFDYLQKPLEMEELRAVVHAAIREKGLLVDLETRLNQVVGKRLRAKRTKAQLTLKQLANRTGLSVGLISQIELGKSAASMSTLHKLATALQIRMTYFFETL